MIGKVAAPRPLAPSRRDSEVTEQSADFFAQFFPMHNHVDQTVLLEKFSGLKSFRQLLMSGFFDHPWPCEADHAFGLSDNNVAQRSKAGHDSSSSRVCENRN